MTQMAAILLLAAFFGQPPSPPGVKGKVIQVSGYAVRIELEPGAVVQPGDSVTIGFDAPRVGMVPIEGLWRVSRVEGRFVEAVPAGATAQPRVGQITSISAKSPEGADAPSGSRRFGNRDVLDMHKAGFGAELIAEKIRTSACSFDTTPEALIQLKNAGVPESVLVAMLRVSPGQQPESASQPQPQVNQQPPAAPQVPPAAFATPEPPPAANAVSPLAPQPPRSNALAIRYVKSNRKWRYGVRSEPYNKISEYFEKQLTKDLGARGFQRAPSVASGCCVITIELLQVTSRPAMIKKPGIDVSANLTVSDASGRTVFSKGFRGESKTLMNTWGNLIEHAVEDMSKSVAADETFLRVLATGAVQ